MSSKFLFTRYKNLHVYSVQARNLTVSHRDLCTALVHCNASKPCLYGKNLDAASLALTVGMEMLRARASIL